ncbi:5'-methylthioadenosine/S-adenosylhomocysteine nucleosidase [Bradyrhizobium sp. SSUT112]|uniref:5'-methylthioadenosine/S-adenosylhomocysteine nucleosidase n=1 Tax=Bradyrhizobium sp. SSUT112 TaxID=3040604 RepID=UPI002448B1CB|nr:5'-methylthioadenosine/S-adenosylhomocysteine nucleosidase [Bradyrhizobium sp. SSUT112]MDH2355608.1 5'-methylthioadenosine/S-adenosylhomocysteine nucleosidase [Bradyrhizobium sp. SSUT112]
MQPRRTSKYLDPSEAAYLELLIGDRDPESKKIGLQRLSKLYRQGLRHRDPERIAIHLMGLLHHEEPKVKRWALNALALIGDQQNVRAVVEAIQRNRNDPDILAAGVSALCALLPVDQARQELERADLPLAGATLLAAVQHSGHFQSELRIARVRIDYADTPELRLAGILVGLDKAPEHLFSLNVANYDAIGELNSHPDPIVAQYSVWATYENPSLTLKNLRLPLHDVDAKPPNVRKYVYQLAVKNVQTAQDNYDFLVLGSEDPSAEARAGLATGLRGVYFDGLEALVMDWLNDEDADRVKQRLLEHMARNADNCSAYAQPALRAYEAADAGSLTRARLEAAARNTSLYTAMKRIEYNAEGQDLFRMEKQSSTRASGVTERAAAAKVLIITALPKENAAVRATLDEMSSLGKDNDSNLYCVGTFVKGADRREIILASAGVGKANAATVTTNALRSFPTIDHIVMVGIAGGCPNPESADEDVHLGDIVYSSNAGIIEYDYVKETREGRKTRSSLQRPSARLLQAGSQLATRELMSERPWEATLSHAIIKLGDKFARPPAESDVLHAGGKPVPRSTSKSNVLPRVLGGAIGTADTLLKHDTTRDQLHESFNIRAVEMEASGLQNAAWSHGKDVFVVRGICDYCDEHKNDIWQNYSALVAAAYTRALVEEMPIEWFKR